MCVLRFWQFEALEPQLKRASERQREREGERERNTRVICTVHSKALHSIDVDT